MLTRAVAGKAILIFVTAASALEASAIKIGSVANTRFSTDWTLDGPEMVNTRAKLLNLANFGSSGTVRRAIEITDTAATAGSIDAALLDHYEVFFIGWLFDSSTNAFTAPELNALKSWVWRGGSLIVTCDDESADDVCAAFGHPAGGPVQSPAIPVVEAADHPLVQGPFGAAAQVYFSGDVSTFVATTGAVVVMTDSSPEHQPAVIVRRWGAGRVILMTDVDLLAHAATAGSGISTDNDRFLGNLFAFAARPYDLLIDAAAHTGGLNATMWRSDVDLLNIGAAEAAVSISQLKVSQANLSPTQALVTVPAGGTLRLTDVLAGVLTGGNAALGVTFAGSQVFANSRFYNVGAADGSVYGMYIPSSDDRDTVWYGRPGVFHHLSYTPGSTAGTRVNIGGASRVPYPSIVAIKLYGDDGSQIGLKTYTFQPYEHRQFTKIHEALATPAVTQGYATVEVTTPGGAVDMYAMLIENKSGDPIFMPPSFFDGDAADAVVAFQRGGTAALQAEPRSVKLAAGGTCSGPYERIIAAAAATGGVNGSKWESDIDLLNLSEDVASIDIARLKANQANSNPLVATFSVSPGQTLRLTRILDTLLPAANAGLGFRFCSGNAFVNSRFYNTGSGDGKVYGMYIPSMTIDQTVTPCRPAVFHHLAYSPDATKGQRINIGATNATDLATTWVIRLFGDNGELLGTQTATLQPFEHHQYTNIHKILGTGAVAHGWASVEVTTPGAAIHPYAMRIENVGGDPIYMPAELEKVSTSPDLAAAFSGQWTGSWNNATYSTSGHATLSLNPDLPAQYIEAVLDLDGNVFGAGDPPAQTLVGAFTEKGIVFQGTSAVLGTYDVSADGFCKLSGRITSLPNPSIDSVYFEGTATTTRIALTYTITFTPAGGGGTATGTVTLTK